MVSVHRHSWCTSFVDSVEPNDCITHISKHEALQVFIWELLPNLVQVVGETFTIIVKA